LLAVLLTEALDASGGIDELLLAREKRVALGADVGVNLRLGRSGLVRISASAPDGGRSVNWMNIGLHVDVSSLFWNS
jgi:hypothetical protein